MNLEEKILKDFETPKGMTKMYKWFDKYAKKEKIKNAKIKIKMSNTNYLEWFNQFAQDKDEFFVDVEKLSLFYERIY